MMSSKFGTKSPRQNRPLLYDTRLNVLISSEQHAKLHAIADYTGQPFSRVIREAIDEAIAVYERARSTSAEHRG